MYSNQSKGSPISKIGFLTHAPDIEIEFLISKKILAKCYRVDNYILVIFTDLQRQIWAELTQGILIEVPQEKVMAKLTIEQRKEFVENWSLLKKKNGSAGKKS